MSFDKKVYEELSRREEQRRPTLSFEEYQERKREQYKRAKEMAYVTTTIPGGTPALTITSTGTLTIGSPYGGVPLEFTTIGGGGGGGGIGSIAGGSAGPIPFPFPGSMPDMSKLLQEENDWLKNQVVELTAERDELLKTIAILKEDIANGVCSEVAEPRQEGCNPEGSDRGIRENGVSGPDDRVAGGLAGLLLEKWGQAKHIGGSEK